MRHPERVADYLEHIAEAIERAASYVRPLPDRAAFEQNQQIQDAVIRHPELPWAQMRAMRNVVIHQYFNERNHEEALKAQQQLREMGVPQ